jgi:hypothetical protein
MQEGRQKNAGQKDSNDDIEKVYFSVPNLSVKFAGAAGHHFSGK